MKRGQPLRRTELRRHTPLAAGCSLSRTGPLNPVSKKRRSDNTERRKVVSGMRLACEGRCARCGRRDMPVSGHERLGRAQGGDILNPDCLLCPICNSWAEDEPVEAARTGWKVSNKHPHDERLDIGQAWDVFGNVVDFTVLAEQVA